MVSKAESEAKEVVLKSFWPAVLLYWPVCMQNICQLVRKNAVETDGQMHTTDRITLSGNSVGTKQTIIVCSWPGNGVQGQWNKSPRLELQQSHDTRITLSINPSL